jgi:hypothetical protein
VQIDNARGAPSPKKGMAERVCAYLLAIAYAGTRCTGTSAGMQINGDV